MYLEREIYDIRDYCMNIYNVFIVFIFNVGLYVINVMLLELLNFMFVLVIKKLESFLCGCYFKSDFCFYLEIRFLID